MEKLARNRFNNYCRILEITEIKGNVATKWISFFVVNLKILSLSDPCISERCIKIKIKSNFHFHTSLWCLKGLHETF